ncbi:heme/hemin ABC transporter substrate-binding protein [Winslowiella iniecta]|uniref:Hemin ABC transporter substrate-binding protein n=1 Tax=Winslowiella iniecta TaxID=1560201 RepID=A0A0L7SW42_9GAMM|nr:hemin ABC transporter substrate-binding protein [Winslowiella iniecta]KOC87290.1 hemin ABC transporter substrate-binding protein [Winslowiella iniecta]KOC93975.1 hemin ABC transporter substrate-binding protein [Winslowiella iniecta]
MKRWLIALLALPLSALATERVVSIGGDVTQIVYALDAQQNLVGRDSTSLHPAVATKLPDVGYMRQLSAEGILALKPTLVLVSELAKPSMALEQVQQAGVKVVTVSGKADIQAIDDKITTIAQALKREEAGKSLQQSLDKQLASLNKQPLPVKVLFIMAHNGVTTMSAGSGTAADAAIHTAGLQNAMSNVQRYQPLSQEGVIASAPQLVVVGEDGLRTLGGKDNLWQLPGLAMTPAGQHHQLLVVDDMALLGFGIDTPGAIVKLRKAAEAIAK